MRIIIEDISNVLILQVHYTYSYIARKANNAASRACDTANEIHSKCVTQNGYRYNRYSSMLVARRLQIYALSSFVVSYYPVLRRKKRCVFRYDIIIYSFIRKERVNANVAPSLSLNIERRWSDRARVYARRRMEFHFDLVVSIVL